MQIKSIITCHFTSAKMAIINKDKPGKVVVMDVKKLKLFCVPGEIVKCCSFFEKQFGIELSCDVANIVLDIYPKEMKTYINKKTCTLMIMAASFILFKR